MNDLATNTNRIYHRHLKALNALLQSADAKAAGAVLYLALDELALLQPSAPTQDAELQLIRLNEWLAENAPNQYQEPGDTADAVISALEALDNSLTLKTGEFNRLATQHTDIANRLQAADEDVVQLQAEVAQKNRRLADIEAALEETNSRPHTLNVVAATPTPNGNGPDYGHMSTPAIVASLRHPGKRGTYFYGTDDQLREAVKALVMQMYGELGRAPSKTEFNGVCSQHNIPTVDAVVHRLGLRWSEIITQCGIEPNKSFAQQEPKVRKPGAYFRYTGSDAELEAVAIGRIQALAATLGHTPSRIDFDTERPDGLPTIDGITRRLQLRWMDLVTKAGFAPLTTTAKEGASESGARFPQG